LTFSVAVSGKGGTGKTTIAALLTRILWEKTGKLVLAVDADPNSNLGEFLGVRPSKTVGDIREDLLREKDRLPPEQTKDEYLNYMILSSIVEAEGFDLLTMGRPEGPGCYCYVNTILRRLLDSLEGRYAFMVVDCEAGLEHFSRRTTRDLDVLLILTDATKRGLTTVERIKELVGELDLRFRSLFILGNRIPPEFSGQLEEEAKTIGLPSLGMIPPDPQIQRLDLEGAPIFKLPEASTTYRFVEEVAGRLLKLQKPMLERS
jgi:CO dehydrogenase maturation factor